MAGNTAAQLYAAFSGNADSDVALRLLRSRDAMAYLAIMAARLGEGQVAGDHLVAGIEQDLADLADHWTVRDREVPAAEDLLDRWVRLGYLSRTLDADENIERYQLTRGAITAINHVQSVEQDRSVATETVMQMVISRLSNIAVAINPDPGAHIRDIDEKISELARRREELAAGAVPVANARGLLDDITMVTSLAQRMPADILGYGERMREMSRTLLVQGVDDASYADILNRMFDGHDALAQSPEGQAFDAFYALISDHRLRERLESYIDAITTGLPTLPDDLRATLAGFIDRMWDEVQRVDEVRGQVYRRINTFVKDGDFLAYRALRQQISDAQRAAAEAFDHASPSTDLGLEVPMSVVDSNSVGALNFHDGIVDIPDSVHSTSGEIDIDPSDLVGSESIDWETLTDAVNGAIADGPADLAAVLAQIPRARTGDVVGIWSLAARHGRVDADADVTVAAHTARGMREIRLPAMTFAEALPHPNTPAAVVATTLLDELELRAKEKQ